MDIKSFKTLTGLTLDQVHAQLDRELPADAYKEIKGSHGKDGNPLTDIDPNYATDVLNEVFGVCGIGWGYEYKSEDLSLTVEMRKTSRGDLRRVCTVILKQMTFWFKLADDEGNEKHFTITAGGASDNDDEAYAIKGAVTYALGNAISKLGWQKSVYQGERSHLTVKRQTLKSAPTLKPATVAKPSAPAASKANVSCPSNTTIAKLAPASDNPAQFVVKIGKHAGKTLDEIYQATPQAVEFYTTMATGNNADKETLKNTAIAFLAKHNGHVPQSVAA